MRPHYFFGSVTRTSDLWNEPFEVDKIPMAHWSTGDFVVGRVIGKRNRLFRCETKTGRMAELVRGDLMVGALGRREATLEGVGDWRAIGDKMEMETLTSAGLLGRATSISPLLPDLMRLKYKGHVTRNGVKLGMKNFISPVAYQALTIPVIMIIGTSMSAGKTSSGQVIIRALKYLGFNVAASKLTGAARYQDILSFRDAGANSVYDFVDAGLPSTVCPEEEFRDALQLIFSKVMASGADVLVAEAGASPLEPYNGAVAVESVGELTRMTVLCASDPYAVLGVQNAFGDGLRADLVTGPAANTEAAVNLVRELTGLTAINLLDRSTYPALTQMLRKAMRLDCSS